MWGFMFPLIDIRLVRLAGFALGLMIAKLWEPILYLDWYWYLVITFGFNKTCNDILETGINYKYINPRPVERVFCL